MRLHTCTHVIDSYAKNHIHMLKILMSCSSSCYLSEFGRLWRHQNSPACTKNIRVFRVLQLDSIVTMQKKFPFPADLPDHISILSLG